MDSLRPEDPRRVGHYVLTGRLGAGGMGEVFFGRSRGGRPVAVKVIYPIFANDADFRRRFRLEVEAGRKVGGFHAAEVVDADPDAERPWMVTAYVAGPSLEQVLREHRALPPGSVKVLGAGVAEALDAIHSAGLIHRDLKPSNILLAEDGPHVIDFGVARAIDAAGITARSGTAGFMAPEVLLGRPLTSACDVFALGVVLAFATGIQPFGAGPAEAIAYRVVHEEPDLADVDPQIRDLIAACLAKEPSERPTPATILELLAGPDLPTEWLPPPLQSMVATHEPPDRPATVAATDRARAARLLDHAEQIARALPLDEHTMAAEDRAAAIPGPPPPPASSSAGGRGLDHEYDRALPLAVQRARALVHVATVTARSDPAHAARLLDDALHPSWNQASQGTAGYNHILEALVWHSAAEFGMLLARIDPSAAHRLVAGVEKLLPVTRALNHREFLDDAAPFIAKVAEAVAEVDIASAEELVWPMGAPARDVALAKVAMVAARTDPTRAGQIALTVTGRPGNPPGQGRSPREAPPPPSMLESPDQAIYWKARALAEIAVLVAGAGPDRSVRLPDDAERFDRTIADPGTLRDTPPASAEARDAETGPLPAGQLLAEAEQWARAISRSDLQNMALASVKAAAAQIDPGHAAQLLAEAEQYARAVSGAPARLETLGEVALAAARAHPAQAEQVIGGLPPDVPKLAEVAMAAALTDPACGERIAARSADGYLQALVRAVVAVRTEPALAGPLLEQAVEAAGNDAARMAEVAIVMASADPARAEQLARTIEAGAGMTAGYWRARTLAGLANVSLGQTPGGNDTR
ncbi:MAG TPA: serine/threonine-protein kinase [Streptosporangiaceae bacterium]|nr:serine/threonine-protein kinase [Streptosporangiaceae bacterium]